ncbi:MAG: zinc-binding alcohol dehydrogenase family protein [Bermanella sp.]|jgi:zinc-binding alcohol dehydrogenase family protein|uniref:zinc-binding alcohol dehydrogenase family protein n=1 Tax=Glaciecola sp. 33A TaxID=2057807 RepID=UPI000C326897|nr:zinc-binding alcohol dehydrogenase family protein [Glaciecola sp. 33A]PKI02882.1 zinc-binding alcohol dehydrogenase family protein [Glaciecola sp. 33A]
MKAVAFTNSLPIDDIHSLTDTEVPTPTATGRDILVEVKAISVNPVDYKIRQNMPPIDGQAKILGWDASGVIIEIGQDVENYQVGDLVYYAGDLTRPGSNAQYQLVDERIVGMKPANLSFAESAALPLTSITAWELLFEHLQLGNVDTDRPILLVTGAAGGVGSILIQLAKQLTNAIIIATASRDTTQAWVESLGADHVINHHHDIKQQLLDIGINEVTHVAGLNATESYFSTFVDLLVPFGKIAIIDDPKNIDIGLIKRKSLSFHWEFMFARSMFKAKDMCEQSVLLNKIATLVEEEKVRTTLTQTLGTINAINLRKAHQLLEAGQAQGKIVLAGF